MSTRTKPHVVMSHAGVQYAYQTAIGLQKAELLTTFYNTIYYDESKWPYGILERYPVAFLEPILQDLRKRRHDERIDPRLIHEIRWPELIERGAKRLLGHTSLIPYLRNDLFDRYVTRFLKNKEFDVFYGYSGSALYCLRQAKRMGKITIVDQHDIHFSASIKLLEDEMQLHPDFMDTIPYWPPYQPYLDRVEQENGIVDYHFVPSTFALRSFVKAGIDPKKIFVIPFGVDPARFQPPQYTERVDRPFKVLFVGAIGQRKGIKYVLEAMRQLALPKAQVVLVGNIIGDAKRLDAYDGLYEHVGFVSQDKLREYYQTCDVFVLPSLYDSFGMVIVEAMGSGLPVIVSENTAGRDVVRDGVDGFVVPVRDIEALKEKLLLLYEDKKLRQQMGRNAYEQAQNFTWEHYHRKLAQVIEHIYAGEVG